MGFVGSQLVKQQVEGGVENAAHGGIGCVLGLYAAEKDATSGGIDCVHGAVPEFGTTTQEPRQKKRERHNRSYLRCSARRASNLAHDVVFHSHDLLATKNSTSLRVRRFPRARHRMYLKAVRVHQSCPRYETSANARPPAPARSPVAIGAGLHFRLTSQPSNQYNWRHEDGPAHFGFSQTGKIAE